MVDYAGAALGTAFGELFALVEHLVKTVTAFRGQLKEIQTTLFYIEPIIKIIIEYNNQLNRSPEEMAPINDLLAKGKARVGKCSKIHAYNLFAKYWHSKKLADFNAALEKKLHLYMQLLSAKDEKEMLVHVEKIEREVKEVKDVLTTVVWGRGAFQSGPGEPDFIVGSGMVESSRRRITSWKTSDLLGSGSFGTVYEGFTENFIVGSERVESSRRGITSWQKGCLLGRGSFGTVYEGVTDDGFFFAGMEVSLLDQESQGKQSLLQLEREISFLSQFEHENIVRYFGTEKDDKKLYIFLELVTKGSLATLYHKYYLRDSQVSAYTRQILNGLKYLHGRKVVHRDIKCANILLDASGFVKLADFGLAKATKMSDAKSCEGTIFWMAPEVIDPKNGSCGLAADIWSLGCTVLEMLTGQHPYPDLEWFQALFRIGNGHPPPVPFSLSREARDFILRCLQLNPNDRPSAAQLLDHPFVKKPSTSSGFDSPRFNNIWP